MNSTGYKYIYIYKTVIKEFKFERGDMEESERKESGVEMM